MACPNSTTFALPLLVQTCRKQPDNCRALCNTDNGEFVLFCAPIAA